MQILIGFLLGALIGFLAWKVNALTPDGAVAAGILGGVIFGLGGFPWAFLLLTFFISSSLFSRLLDKRKIRFTEKFSKGNRRDWKQVLANGGLGAGLAAAQAIYPHTLGWFLAFAGAMAAVTADTWATELGLLSPMPPRLITTGRKAEQGDSGAISLIGSLSGAAGAGLIAISAVLFVRTSLYFPILTVMVSLPSLTFFILILLGGLTGMFFDSFLGATIQAMYFCPQCVKETEKYPVHSCGADTVLLHGWKWLDNDWVNFFCSAFGASIPLLLALVFGFLG